MNVLRQFESEEDRADIDEVYVLMAVTTVNIIAIKLDIFGSFENDKIHI